MRLDEEVQARAWVLCALLIPLMKHHIVNTYIYVHKYMYGNPTSVYMCEISYCRYILKITVYGVPGWFSRLASDS